jgi:C-terminal processing protease CtpA/Prc
MKFRVLLLKLVLIIIIISGLQAQPEIEFNQNTRLSRLANVWGFLKYYHPGVAKGLVDWDEVLLDAINPIKEADSKDAFNDVIAHMIRQAGDVNFLNFLHIFPDDVPLEPDFLWIEDDTFFNWYTKLKLKAIKQHHRLVYNVYVGYKEYVGNVDLEGEEPYSQMIYPEEEYRLLSLFRYWNVIHYFFPYKYLIGSNWDDVLTEFIPIFTDASNATEYHLAVRQLIARINDSHSKTSSEVLSDYWGYYYPPFATTTIEGKTVVTLVYTNLIDNPDSVRVGDVILAANDIPIETIKQRLEQYMGASNPPTKQRILNPYIFRGDTDSLILTLLREDSEKNVKVTRYLWDLIEDENERIDHGDIWKTLDGNIGYVDMGRLEQTHVHHTMEDLMDTRAIIFDIRNYPRGTMHDISDYLNPNSREFAKFTKPDPSIPGKFIYTPTLYTGPDFNNDNYYKGKVILLINETTQSHAEFTCMALQTAPDVTIIGSQTAGADGNVSFVLLPGGIRTYFTGIGVYYPDGRETQRIGIVPDIVVTPTIRGIREGRDEVLEKALEFINTRSNNSD